MTLDLNSLAHELRTQDNQYTADPIYLVQKKVRSYGIDPQWCEHGETVFIDMEDECNEVDLEARGLTWEQAQEAEHLEETGYRDDWEFVNAHFTLRSAEQFIKTNAHRYRRTELRVYVDSMYRCPEMIAIREFLMGFTVRRLVESLDQLVTHTPDKDSDMWDFARKALGEYHKATN